MFLMCRRSIGLDVFIKWKGRYEHFIFIVDAIICSIYCNNLICQSDFVINRVDALYVLITDKFLCLMSIAYIRKHSKTNTLFSHFSSNTLHTVQKYERKTHKQSCDLNLLLM
jgi:hypothetical protein